MAFALVGAVGAVSTGSAGAAVTPAYGAGSSRTANNLLILHVLTTGSATLPAAPAGWSIAKQQAGTSCSASIFYKLAAGADAAPTVALVTSAIHNARLSEFSGSDVSAPLDQTAGASGITTPLVATAGAVDALAAELVIGCGGAINSAARANTMSHTLNNGVVDTETTNGATSTVSHYDFTYGTTTGKAAADSDSFAFVTTQLTGAVLALVSFKLFTVVFNDSGSGTITAGGSGIDSYQPTYEDISSGIIAASGIGAESVTYTDSASGTVTANGPGVESYVYIDAGTTTVTASGSGVESYSIPTFYDGVIDVDNPTSHWKLGSATTAIDRKGVRNLPAIGGPITVVSGIIANNASDQANQFVGTATQSFDAGTGAGFGTPYDGALTMEAWVRPTADADGVVVKRTPSTSLGFVNTGGGIEVQLQFSFENSANVAFSVTTPSAFRLKLNQTHHVVGTYDGTTAILYINGVEAIRTISVGVGGVRSATATPPFIGASRAGTWPRAVVDEVAWYSGALSPARVLAHYQAGAPGVFFNDSRLGTVTASGAGVESATYADSGSGIVTASGTGTETYQGPADVYTDTGAGIVTATGSGVESVVFTDSASGTVTASGSGVESFQGIVAYTDTRSGTVTASGNGIESYACSDSASGTITANGSSSESYLYADFGSGTITVSGSGVESYFPPLPPTPYDLVIDVDSPVSHWKLGDPNIAVDRKGVRSLPALNGPIVSAASLIANNDGDSSNILVRASSQLFRVSEAPGIGAPYQSSVWSVEAWFSLASTPASGVVYSILGRDSHQTIRITGSADLQLRWRDAGDVGNAIGASLAVVGSTYHVVGTYDGTTAIFYVNGVENARVATTSFSSLPNAVPSIGTQNGSPTFALDGTVDEIAWYNTVLSPARVLAHFQAGSPGTAYNDSRSGTIAVSGTRTESTIYTDSRTCIATVSGSGIDSYVTDTTAPIPTVTVVDVTKISRVVGKDVVNVTFTSDEAFVEYEIRRVSSGSDSQAAGNQVETASVSSRTSHSTAITDDELIAAAAIEGSNTLKIFVKDVAGNWST